LTSGKEIMRRSLFIAPAVAVVAVAAATMTGSAAFAATPPPGPTVTTFTVTAGSLTMTTPGTADLGTVTAGTSSVVNALGPVTISDQRAQLSGGWTASVSSTSFTTGGGTTPETIPAADVSYAPGAATSTSGTGTFTPGSGGALGGSQTAFTASGEAGLTSVTWNPTITVTLPATTVAGLYTGMITHSVA
jgi:hypothetical protein